MFNINFRVIFLPLFTFHVLYGVDVRIGFRYGLDAKIQLNILVFMIQVQIGNDV